MSEKHMKTRFKIIITSLSAVALLSISAIIAVPKIIDYINNHPTPPKLLPNKRHIACIGDSITWGAGVWNQRNKSTFEVILNNRLGEDYQVLNYGLNGRCLLDESDWPYTKESFYKISHDINAEKYIIMLGSNDSKPHNWKFSGENGINYKNQLKDFLISYINLPSHPDVYVMQPPKAYPINGVIPYKISDDVIKNEIFYLVKEVGDELNIPVIDLYTITDNHPEYFPDGVHPNKEGNIVIANAIYGAL